MVGKHTYRMHMDRSTSEPQSPKQRGTVNRAVAKSGGGLQCSSGQQRVNQGMQEAWGPLVSNEYKPELFYS